MTTLLLNPSLPYQVEEELVSIWLPGGHGLQERSVGLAALVEVCANPNCPCSVASFTGVPIDDRAESVDCDGKGMGVEWGDSVGSDPLPEGSFSLTLDLATGEVEAPDGKNLPDSLARFFEKPIPSWVLDHFWGYWQRLRIPAKTSWKERMLEVWEPGELLSTMIACPGDRPDWYLLGGKVYQMDSLFCVTPECDCQEGRLCLFEVRQEGNKRNLTEVASAWVSLGRLVPREIDGTAAERALFSQAFLLWNRRHDPASERFRELRDRIRSCGVELYRLATEVHPEAAQPMPRASGKRPGRNEPCPCGSGKKYKRCCLRG